MSAFAPTSGASDAYRMAKERVSQGTPPQAVPGFTTMPPDQQASLQETYAKTKATHTVPGPATAPQSQFGPQTPQGPQQQGPVSPSPNAVPQYQMPTQPVPQYTPPDFTPAQYQPPKKGLEYAAMALALLFPGAPIARAAAGFAQGLNQGAEQSYQRKEKQAEQQYEVGREKAQAGYENAKAAYDAAQAKSQADFANAQIRFQVAQQQRAQGMDPATGKPMVFPPVQSLLPKTVDPKTKKISIDQSSGGYAKAYGALATQAMQRGATELAKQYATDAKDYDMLARTEYTQASQNARTAAQINARLTAAMMSEGAAQSRENQRENFDLALAGVREGAAESRQQLSEYRTQATNFFNTFRTQWIKDFLVSPGKDPKGNPLQPALAGQQQTVHALMRRIDRTDDPYGAAQWMSQFQSDQRISDLILTYGQAKEAARQAQGYKIGNFQGPDLLPKGIAEKIAPFGPAVQQTLYSELLAGKSIQQIETEIAGSQMQNKDAIIEALTGKKHEASVPSGPAPSLTTGGMGGIGI